MGELGEAGPMALHRPSGGRLADRDRLRQILFAGLCAEEMLVVFAEEADC